MAKSKIRVHRAALPNVSVLGMLLALPRQDPVRSVLTSNASLKERFQFVNGKTS